MSAEIKLMSISRSRQAEKLYKLEEKRADLMREIASEYAKVMRKNGFHGYGANPDESGFWDKTLPEVLLSTLDSYSPRTALPAAEKYVEIQKAKLPK